MSDLNPSYCAAFGGRLSARVTRGPRKHAARRQQGRISSLSPVRGKAYLRAGQHLGGDVFGRANHGRGSVLCDGREADPSAHPHTPAQFRCIHAGTPLPPRHPQLWVLFIIVRRTEGEMSKIVGESQALPCSDHDDQKHSATARTRDVLRQAKVGDLDGLLVGGKLCILGNTVVSAAAGASADDADDGCLSQYRPWGSGQRVCAPAGSRA
jgi:hypothetical protein